MSGKKKNSRYQKDNTNKLLLITAVTSLIKTLIELIKVLIE